MTRSVFAALFALALTALIAACPPKKAVCGDGVVDVGETEATCCKDTGCAFGSCNPTKNACESPWVSTCASANADGCAGPYVCSDATATTPPSYDCGSCGCGQGAVCSQTDPRFCESAQTQSLNRLGTDVATNLAPDDYVKLFTDLATQHPSSLSSLASQMAQQMHADPRTGVLLIGASPDADATFVRDFLVQHLGLPPSTLTAPARTDLEERTATSADACSAVGDTVKNVNHAILPQGFITALVPPDAAAHPTCPYLGSYASCELPLVEDCVVAAGRFAETVLLVDMTAELARVDERLLVRAGEDETVNIGHNLDTNIALFNNAATLLANQPGLAVNGRVVGVYSTFDPSASFVVLADNTVKPLRMLSFRGVWNDAPAQSYLIAHNVTTADCTFTFAASIDVVCADNNASLHAVVDGTTFAVTNVTTSP